MEAEEHFRVRFSEVAGDHAYYADYFVWFEIGIGALFQRYAPDCLGREDDGLSSMVVEGACRYQKPGRFDEELSVRTRLVEAASKRIHLHHQIRRSDGTVLAEGDTAHVHVDRTGPKLIAFPPSLLEVAEQRVERIELCPEDQRARIDPARPTNETEIRVRYREVDALGILYYSNHYIYYEVGRTELLRSLGWTFDRLAAEGLQLPVAQAYCLYLNPIRYGETVSLKTGLAQVKGTKVVFAYELCGADGEPAARAHTVHGCLGPDGRPRRLPESLAAALQSREGHES